MTLSQREQMTLRGIEDELGRQDPALSARLVGAPLKRCRIRLTRDEEIDLAGDLRSVSTIAAAATMAGQRSRADNFDASR